ncbi:MAG: O-methyltransferase [Anaerolineaceae bacterium]|nr:O-methyltransferase [Anaerolineaceae bacterium]
MFHQIPESMRKRMQMLEDIDTIDRSDGTPRLQRLRQIPPVTGQFIALLAATTPDGEMVEIGTSAGYSSMWIIQACKLLGRKLKTCEIMPEKIALAKETFCVAEVEEYVQLLEGDAREYLNDLKDISFCFLDAEKEVYADCYEIVIPKLVPGGLLVADNAINHREILQPMLDRALADERVDAMIVPIAKGELVCRKI